MQTVLLHLMIQCALWSLMSIGLILASTYILMNSLENNATSLVLTLASAAVVYYTRLNAIWLIILGVVIGLCSSWLGASWF